MNYSEWMQTAANQAPELRELEQDIARCRAAIEALRDATTWADNDNTPDPVRARRRSQALRGTLDQAQRRLESLAAEYSRQLVSWLGARSAAERILDEDVARMGMGAR